MTRPETEQWQPMGGEPRDGTPFLAFNHDRELWLAKWTEEPDPRLAFRTNKLLETSSYEVVTLRDGREARIENWRKERWNNNWTLWTRGYEFRPTHWMPLPAPPSDAQGEKP